MNKSLVDLSRKLIPRNIRYAIQQIIPMYRLKINYFAAQNPYLYCSRNTDNPRNLSHNICIVKNDSQSYKHFIAACLEMRIPFTVIDLGKSDWMEIVKGIECDLFLIWPNVTTTIANQMSLERATILQNELGKLIYPSLRELQLYENKRNMYYWLKAYQIPHPKTWIFYSLDEAIDFADKCELPVVFKTNFGASATGVRIINKRYKIIRLINRAFKTGIVPNGHNLLDKQWGHVILQEFVKIRKEWRMVRIGDSFFGHAKGSRGSFHSGTGLVDWSVPDSDMLHFLKRITDMGNFTSMDVDLFQTEDGMLLVNELQTFFGASFSVDQLRINGKTGRFIFNKGTGKWIFEEGDFARNACANERIRYLLESNIQKRS